METATTNIGSQYFVTRRPRSRSYLLAGRLGAVFAILAFAFSYLHGIIVYGPLAGIVLGWIPSSAFAWLIFLGTVEIAPLIVRFVRCLRLPFDPRTY